MSKEAANLKVGIVGLGHMGKPLAVNVAKSGFDLMVCDLRDEPLKELTALGAKIARSPQELGQHSEVIELAVVDDAQVEAVMLGEKGVLSGAKPGAVAIIHSTIHPKTVRKIAERAQAQGVGVIDAEMSGGPGGVESRTLTFMVGGKKEHVDKCRPVLAASGNKLFHMGELGKGALAKLAHQVVCVGTLVAVSEGMLLAEKAGLDPKAFSDVINASAAQSFMSERWLDRFSQVDDSIVEIFFKCLIPALELGHELGVALPNTALVQQLVPSRIGRNAKSRQ
jgi:3-hydroxyisobutyrate dehydrogenase